MKKVLSLILALIFVFGLAAPAFAYNEQAKISIYNTDTKKWEVGYCLLADVPKAIMDANWDTTRCEVNLNGYELLLDEEIYLSWGDFTLTIKNGTINCQNRTRAFWLEDSGTELSMEDIVIKNGNSDDGGAIYINDDNCYVHGVPNMPEKVIIQDCYSYNCGGAIRTSYASDKTIISDITFNNNDCYDDGGAMLSNGDGTQVVNCVFNGNTAGDAGGAIYAWDGMEIIGCTFDRENAAKCGYGHDIYCYANDVTLTNNKFQSDAESRIYNAYKNVGATKATILSDGSLLEVILLAIITIGVVAIYISSKKKKSVN